METRVLDRLGGHAPAWDLLVDQMPLVSPFLRSWWLSATTIGEARFILVFDGEVLIGGLAVQRSMRAGLEWLQFAGSGPLEPDHLDLVSDTNRVSDVVRSVHEWLYRPGNRVVELNGARPGAWVLDTLEGSGGAAPLEVAPYVELPATADEYLASLGGRMRSTIKRARKRLEKDGVSFRSVGGAGIDVEPADLQRSLTALRTLHDGRWGAESGFLSSWAGFSDAVMAGGLAGEFVFHQLETADGEIIAIEADLVVGGRMSFYQAGRLTDHEWRGSGSVLRFDVISAAISAGCSEFDLLRGGEEYKAEWANRRRGLVSIRRGIGPKGRTMVAGAVAKAKVTAMVQRVSTEVARRRETFTDDETT